MSVATASAQTTRDTIATFDVLGISIGAVSLEKTSYLLREWAKDNVGRYVGVRDVASTVVMAEDPFLLAVARGAALNVPDGMPLVWLGKQRGLEISRTCGPDLMEKMMMEAPKNGLKHFLYGGREGVVDILEEKFRARSTQVQIVGAYCPPFRPLTVEEEDDVISRIQSSGADLVWVGISSPKQDVWMASVVGRLSQTLLGVGAAFDFHAGTVRRAPKWMQRNGLEWSYRFLSEPKRLWRRYLVFAPRFVWRAVLLDFVVHRGKKRAAG